MNSVDEDRKRSRRFFLLTTPGAGDGAAWSRLQDVVARIARSAHARVALVRSLEEMTSALETLEDGEIPVAAGGDGTVNLLATAMSQPGGASRVCATVPLGTGNAFAHSLGAGNLSAAITALRSGEPRALDLMELDHPSARVALVSISTGFESRFILRLASLRARRRFAAGARGLAALIEPPSAGAALSLDGQPFVRPREAPYNIGLYNLPCYAFGARVHPEADPEDGRAEAVSHSTAASYWRAIRKGWSNRRPAGSPPLSPRFDQPVSTRGPERFARWKSAVLESIGPIQVDGESFPGGSFRIRVKRAPFEWLMPQAPAPVPVP